MLELDREILLVLAAPHIKGTFVSKVKQLSVILSADREVVQVAELGTVLRKRIRGDTGNKGQH